MKHPNLPRRTFIKHAALTGAGIAFLPSHISAMAGRKQKDTRLQGKRVLFVYGGWKGHEPEQNRNYFVPWLESEGAIITQSSNLDIYADKAVMDGTDLIVQVFTRTDIEEEQAEGLLNAVRNGTGLAGWHGEPGDSFRENVDYQYMVGGKWVAHPAGKIDYEVNMSNNKDGVTNGIPDFRMNSEQYYMHIDPNVKVLATTTFNADHAEWIDGATMPVVWKKVFGNGRVFYSSIGHAPSELEVPEAFEIIKRGIRWAGMSKYKPLPKWMKAV